MLLFFVGAKSVYLLHQQSPSFHLFSHKSYQPRFSRCCLVLVSELICTFRFSWCLFRDPVDCSQKYLSGGHTSTVLFSLKAIHSLVTCQCWFNPVLIEVKHMVQSHLSLVEEYPRSQFSSIL